MVYQHYRLQLSYRKIAGDLSVDHLSVQCCYCYTCSASNCSCVIFFEGMSDWMAARKTFYITRGRSCTFELRGFGLRLHVPEDALPTDVTKTTIDVQVSLSGQYNVPEDSDFASAVYNLSAPVKFLQPISVEIQHCAAFQFPGSNLHFAISKSNQQFNKLDGGHFSHTGQYGSIDQPGFSSLGIIMPKGGPQYYRTYVWLSVQKVDPVEMRGYFVITKDLDALATVRDCSMHEFHSA